MVAVDPVQYFHRRPPNIPPPWRDRGGGATGRTGGQPDARHETNEVLRAITVLTPRHRQVLVLVAMQGLSYQDVAEELGVPLGTVMSRLARARDQLRQALAEPTAGIPAAIPAQILGAGILGQARRKGER